MTHQFSFGSLFARTMFSFLVSIHVYTQNTNTITSFVLAIRSPNLSLSAQQDPEREPRIYRNRSCVNIYTLLDLHNAIFDIRLKRNKSLFPSCVRFSLSKLWLCQPTRICMFYIHTHMSFPVWMMESPPYLCAYYEAHKIYTPNSEISSTGRLYLKLRPEIRPVRPGAVIRTSTAAQQHPAIPRVFRFGWIRLRNYIMREREGTQKKHIFRVRPRLSWYEWNNESRKWGRTVSTNR